VRKVLGRIKDLVLATQIRKRAGQVLAKEDLSGQTLHVPDAAGSGGEITSEPEAA